MADLYPTKTRLELLRAVDAGHIRTSHPSFRVDGYVQHVAGGGLLNAKVREMEAAGWCLEGKTRELSAWKTELVWELTDAGRKVLEEADRADG